MTSDGAENHDEEVFGGGLIYPMLLVENLSCYLHTLRKL